MKPSRDGVQLGGEITPVVDSGNLAERRLDDRRPAPLRRPLGEVGQVQLSLGVVAGERGEGLCP